MGCVGFSRRFFGSGEWTQKAFRKAEVAARIELETIERRYRSQGWMECVGSSGTINAVADILSQSSWTEGPITLPGIKQLRKALLVAARFEALDLPGLSRDRIPVLAGGLAILKAVFEGFGIESMVASKAALREGLLYDLHGRYRQEGIRDRTIGVLSRRYSVDEGQAKRVELTARECLRQVAEAWDLRTEEHGQLLAWAARVHEVGLALSYSGYHKHGAYILANSDMPGFSSQEQERLALLVRGHRRKLGGTLFAPLGGAWEQRLFRLCVLLRIAVRLNRARSDEPYPPFELEVDGDGLRIGFPEEWLETHPLTRADLEDEDAVLRSTGLRISVVSRPARHS